MTAERYVAGRLSEDAREEFEHHYFECDSCFGEVEALRAVKQALPGVTEEADVKKPTPVWVWALPMAAVLLLALFLWPRQSPPRPEMADATPAARDYSELARFDPPAWNQARLRGRDKPQQEALEKARTSYRSHDYAGCAQSLRPIERLTEAHYYEGICLLLAGKGDEGAAAFRGTISAGDTPYLEEAHFYLAKALLAHNDAGNAARELQTVVAMHGDLERQAADLLGRLK